MCEERTRRIRCIRNRRHIHHTRSPGRALTIFESERICLRLAANLPAADVDADETAGRVDHQVARAVVRPLAWRHIRKVPYQAARGTVLGNTRHHVRQRKAPHQEGPFAWRVEGRGASVDVVTDHRQVRLRRERHRATGGERLHARGAMLGDGQPHIRQNVQSYETKCSG